MPCEKKKIIRRVHRKLQQQSETRDYLTAAITYTGLHPSTLKKLDNKEHLKLEVDDFDRSLIYRLCSYYIRYRIDGGKLPTTYELFNTLIRMGKLVHMDIGTFRKLLLKMGFIWQKIGGENSLSAVAVIENPVLRLQRFNYLTEIRRSRVEKYDDIYFIGEVAYSKEMFMDAQESLHMENFGNGASWQQRAMYAVGVKTVTSLKEVDEFSNAVIEDWITADLCPILLKPSIIVAPDSDHYKQKLLETPTLYSTKLEISRWLDFHNVPYDSNMSKFELYSLAEEYTDLETPLYKIDGILKARGHVLLRLPKSIEELSPAVLLYQTIKKNWNPQKLRLDLFSDGQNNKLAKMCFRDVVINAVKYVENYTIIVIGFEKKVIDIEKDMDMKMDKLLMESNSLVMSSAKADSDVASCSDSE